MAKKSQPPIRAFFGEDTFGRKVEVCQAESGKWFSREYGYNGYGNGWMKWVPLEKPSWQTHWTNAYSGEKGLWDKPKLKWGFNTLDEMSSPLPRYRLPI